MSEAGTFWANRRAAVAAEELAEQVARETEARAEQERAQDEMSDAELLAAFDLPDPDSLKIGDDFSAFMAKAVPDRLRRRALRVLWRSNPVLANVDNLVDYGEDFTDSATVVENMQTAYQVGKGMLKHIEEMARQAAEKDAGPKLEEPLEDDAAMALAEEVTDDVPDEMVPAEVGDDPSALDEEDTEYAMAPSTPRRMKFHIEERLS